MGYEQQFGALAILQDCRGDGLEALGTLCEHAKAKAVAVSSPGAFPALMSLEAGQHRHLATVQAAASSPSAGLANLGLLSARDCQNLQLLQDLYSPGHSRQESPAPGRRLRHLELLGPSAVAGKADCLHELQQAVGPEHFRRCVDATSGPGQCSRPVYENLARLGSPTGFGNLLRMQQSISPQHWYLTQTFNRESGQPNGRLALLGCSTLFANLLKLQESLGEPHLAECRRHNIEAPMQGGAAAALRKRQDEIQRREQSIRDREANLRKREEKLGESSKQGMALVPAQSSASPRGAMVGAVSLSAKVSGVYVHDEELRELFSTYDRDGSGSISKREFRLEYAQFENFGLEMTDKELDRIFSSVQRPGGDNERLTFDEFAVLMLQRAKL